MKRRWPIAVPPRLRRQPLALRARARQLLARYFEKPGVRLVHAARLTPNTVTLLGLALTGVAAYFAAQGHFITAGVVFLAASAMDMLDGALARLTNKGTPFGAVLDSVADRVSETLMLLAILWFYVRVGNEAGVLLAFGADHGGGYAHRPGDCSDGAGTGPCSLHLCPEALPPLVPGPREVGKYAVATSCAEMLS
jgi:hypothetical protein